MTRPAVSPSLRVAPPSEPIGHPTLRLRLVLHPLEPRVAAGGLVRLDVEWRGAPVNTDLLADSHASSAVNLLPVRIGSPLGLLLGDIAITLRSLRSRVGFTQVSPSRVASLCPTLLATTHRRRDEQHKEHDCDRDDDHDDTGTHREDRDKGDAQDPISSIACSSVSP